MAGKQLVSFLNTLLARTLSSNSSELIGCCNVTRHALRRLQPFIEACDTPIVFSLGKDDTIDIPCPGLCKVWDDLVLLDQHLREATHRRYHELPPRVFQDKSAETFFLDIVATIKYLEQSCKKYESLIATLRDRQSHHVVLETAMAYTNHQ